MEWQTDQVKIKLANPGPKPSVANEIGPPHSIDFSAGYFNQFCIKNRGTVPIITTPMRTCENPVVFIFAKQIPKTKPARIFAYADKSNTLSLSLYKFVRSLLFNSRRCCAHFAFFFSKKSFKFWISCVNIFFFFSPLLSLLSYFYIYTHTNTRLRAVQNTNRWDDKPSLPSENAQKSLSLWSLLFLCVFSVGKSSFCHAFASFVFFACFLFFFLRHKVVTTESFG